MNGQGRLYFGCRGNLLDPATDRERWFAAVWAYSNGERSVVAHWFADTEDDAYLAWRHSEWYKRCTVLFTPYPIRQVYEEFMTAAQPSGHSPEDRPRD